MSNPTVNDLTQKLIDGAVLNFAGEYTPEIQADIDRLLRRTLDKPVIYIGTGTCGIAGTV